MCYGCLNYCKFWGARGISKERLELGNELRVLSSEISYALENNSLEKAQKQERKKQQVQEVAKELAEKRFQ